MLRSFAKIATGLNADDVANAVMERFYRNTRGSSARFSRRFQILTYHKVSPHHHEFFEPIHPGVFEQQVRFLKQCYRVMPLAELVQRSQQGDVPHRAVAITFDDGYCDNYEFAFPILRKYGLPATVFVATGVIETGDVLWHDRIFDAFRFATVKRAFLEDGETDELILDPPQMRHASLHRTLVKARTLYGEARSRWVALVEQTLRPDYPARHSPRMLGWQQIREMHRAGIEFGSHTVTHPTLSRLSGEELYRELRDSKHELAERIGTDVVSFAYPNGKTSDYNDEVKTMLKRCGYAYAVTTRPGFNCAFADPFELKRGQPWQKEIELFRLNFFLQRHGLAF